MIYAKNRSHNSKRNLLTGNSITNSAIPTISMIQGKWEYKVVNQKIRVSSLNLSLGQYFRTVHHGFFLKSSAREFNLLHSCTIQLTVNLYCTSKHILIPKTDQENERSNRVSQPSGPLSATASEMLWNYWKIRDANRHYKLGSKSY